MARTSACRFVLLLLYIFLSAMAVHADERAPMVDAVRSVVSVLPEWPRGQRNAQQPEGSGVVVGDGSGGQVIVTAWHVISKARSIRVRTHDGVVHLAQRVGHDVPSDLAVLRVAMLDNARAAMFADAPVELAAPVCSIGNAFGLGLSVTCGVVSATRRAGVGFNRVEDFVQTDAAVNPGASGGGLFTRDGRLAGILSAIFTKQSDANIGVNFAVSAELAARITK
ncbi:MAG: trypsin-like peptidase domain-containing protein, partial [Pseudomonadota bacterium]